MPIIRHTQFQQQWGHLCASSPFPSGFISPGLPRTCHTLACGEWPDFACWFPFIFLPDSLPPQAHELGFRVCLSFQLLWWLRTIIATDQSGLAQGKSNQYPLGICQCRQWEPPGKVHWAVNGKRSRGDTGWRALLPKAPRELGDETSLTQCGEMAP